LNRRDPLGLYEEDVHHYLTMFLAEAAGFDSTDAGKIGLAAQEPDTNPAKNAITPSGMPNHGTMERIHFASELRLEYLWGQALSVGSLDGKGLEAIGDYLHALEDSYSHQRNQYDRVFGYSSQYHDVSALGFDIGHGREGHAPDWTWMRPELAMKMAKETYEKLVELCQKQKTNCSPVSFDSIKDKIWSFMNDRPELYEDEILGFPVPDVLSYTEKVKKLDSSYRIAPEEQGPRDEGYKRMLKRNKKRKMEAAHDAAVSKKNWDKQ
jgi:hypothetical protein